MDILTQGLIGSVFSQSVSKKENIRIATVVGFCSGLLADADFLIRSAEDSLLNLEVHRQFTHSLFFVPCGALLAAALLWFPLRRRLSFGRLLVLCFCGYLPAGLLDACTGYGTQLLWPFSDARVAWNLVSVVDPIFSGLLLVGAGGALWRREARWPQFALIACGLYLATAFAQRERAAELARSLATDRGHRVSRALVKPSFANIILWRSVYVAGDRIYTDAIRPGLTGARIYPGESVALFRPEREVGIARDSVLYADVLRFRRFSAGYIGVHPELPDILGDLRFSMLPHRARPLWGIVLDPGRAEEHAELRTFRDLSAADRRLFLDMLFGRQGRAEPPAQRG